VLHLEGRYGFQPHQRQERLAFTAWLSRFPGELTSTTQLDLQQAQLVLKKLGAERDPQRLITEWRSWQQEQHQGEADAHQAQQETPHANEALGQATDPEPLPF